MLDGDGARNSTCHLDGHLLDYLRVYERHCVDVSVSLLAEPDLATSF